MQNKINNLTTLLLCTILFISCQSNPNQAKQSKISEKLTINYDGEADLVQFKMFEGLTQILKKDSISREFNGVVEIQDLNEGIFTYDILVYKNDSSGQMKKVDPSITAIRLNQSEAVQKGKQFLWIGKNRNPDFVKSKELEGSLITKSIKSEFLGEERGITIYTPKEVSTETPHIYFTDGAVVNLYAPYVDLLIANFWIEPYQAKEEEE